MYGPTTSRPKLMTSALEIRSTKQFVKPICHVLFLNYSSSQNSANAYELMSILEIASHVKDQNWTNARKIFAQLLRPENIDSTKMHIFSSIDATIG